MRLPSTSAVVVLVATWAVLPHAQSDRASNILAQARRAIGGEERLGAVHSLSLEAKTRTSGTNIVYVMTNPDGTQTRRVENPELKGKIRLDVLLPDKFLLTRNNGPFHGINGTRPIMNRSAPPPAILIRPQALDRLTALQHREFLRYVIALLLMPPAHYGVQFTDGGEKVTESGPADVVDAAGAYDFSARLYFDKTTHHLLLLSYREPPRSSAGTAPSDLRATPAPETTKPGQPGSRDPRTEPLFRSLEGPVVAPPPGDPTGQIRLAEYRPVEGILFPHQITTEWHGTDEWRISKYDVNGRLDPRRFDK